MGQGQARGGGHPGKEEEDERQQSLEWLARNGVFVVAVVAIVVVAAVAGVGDADLNGAAARSPVFLPEIEAAGGRGPDGLVVGTRVVVFQQRPSLIGILKKMIGVD